MKRTFMSFAGVAAGLVSLPLILEACSNDVTKVDEEILKGASVIGLKEKMPVCNTTNIGDVIYVTDSSKTYICANGEWHVMDGIDGENGKDGEDGTPGKQGEIGKQGDQGASCSMRAIRKSSLTGIEVACGDELDTLWSGKDGENGRDGQDGLDGENGKDGQDGKDGLARTLLSSCSLTKVASTDESRFGVEIACTDAEPDTLWNGVDGKDGGNGNQGPSGDGCTSKKLYDENNKFVAIEVTCGSGDNITRDTLVNGIDGKDGLPGDVTSSCDLARVTDTDGRNGIEVTCGSSAPDTLWNGLNGKDASPASDGANCSSEAVTDENGKHGVTITCGTESTTLWDGSDGGKGPDGNPGNPGAAGAGCVAVMGERGIVEVTCGSGDNEKSFNIYKALCDNEPYDPEGFMCDNGDVVAKGYEMCGDKYYDPASNDCINGIIVNVGWLLCDKEEYDPDEYACYFDKTIDVRGLEICGSALYNPTTHTCYDKATNLADVKGLTYFNGALYSTGSMTDTRTSPATEYNTMTVKTATTSQTWLAQNLNYPTSSGSMCGGSSKDCSTYGRLYNWSAAQTACPSGWHLPTLEEWNTFICTLDAGKCIASNNSYGSEYAGYGKEVSNKGSDNAAINAIRTVGKWPNNSGSTNKTGFSAVPAGFGDNPQNNLQHTDWNIFWSNGHCGNNSVGCHIQLTDTQLLATNQQLGDYYLTVRCIQDAE